jgi:hypothetical protein
MSDIEEERSVAGSDDEFLVFERTGISDVEPLTEAEQVVDPRLMVVLDNLFGKHLRMVDDPIGTGMNWTGDDLISAATKNMLANNLLIDTDYYGYKVTNSDHAIIQRPPVDNRRIFRHKTNTAIPHQGVVTDDGAKQFEGYLNWEQVINLSDRRPFVNVCRISYQVRPLGVGQRLVQPMLMAPHHLCQFFQTLRTHHQILPHNIAHTHC